MKQILMILLVATVLLSCGNRAQNKAVSDAKKVEAGIKQMQPGNIPITEDGWTMIAKFNGKKWTVNSLMPLEAI